MVHSKLGAQFEAWWIVQTRPMDGINAASQFLAEMNITTKTPEELLIFHNG